MEDLTGRTFGQFQIVGPLGEGGMAAVYKAYQPSMDRYVAVKVLPKQYAEDEKFLARFEREAKSLAKLQHPHILQVFDYGQEDRYTYLVMPYVEAGTLSDIIKEKKTLSLDQVRRIISQIGEALDYAHKRGLVHRDIKPSNVLVDESGNCLLTDFGIARMVESTSKITQTGAVIGTPAYMSPEQGQGSDKIDHRSDIYSLGIMLYEMAVGRVPYQAETPVAVIFKHVSAPLPPPTKLRPGLPEALERVILKSLAKDPGSRFETAGDMVQALRIALPEGGAEPDAAFLADDPLFAETVDEGAVTAPAPPEQVGTAAMPPDSIKKTKKSKKLKPPREKKAKPPREKKGMAPALKWGLIGVGGLVGLILIGVLVMFAADICPPEGPWPMPPWCGGEYTVGGVTVGGEDEDEPDQPDQPDEPAGGEDGVLELVIYAEAENTGMAGFDAVVRAFEQQHPDVDVVVEYLPREEALWTFIEAASSGGTPHLAIGGDEWSAELIWNGIVGDVTDLQSEGMPDWVLEDIVFEGNLAGMPFLQRGVILMRNTSIQSDPTDILRDFFSMAREETQGGVYGALLDTGPFFSMGHIYGHGGEIMDDRGAPAFASDEGMAWLEMMLSWGELATSEFYTEQDMELFLAGQVGWIIDGTWNLGAAEEALGGNLAIDPWFPGMSGFRQKELIFLNTNSRGPSKELARDFIAFLVSVEGQQILFDADSNFIPVNTEIDVEVGGFRHQAYMALESGTPWLIRPEMQAYWAAMDHMISYVVYEGGDPWTELEYAATEEIAPQVEALWAEWGAHTEGTDGGGYKVCQVTDVGGIDDRSFNATAWAGFERAQQDFGVEILFLESQQQTDYEVNINAFIEEGCNLIVTVGFLLADATFEAAAANPDVNFAIIDYWNDEPSLTNLSGIVFDVDEAAFLAGYAAAGMSETSVVGTFGGMNIPPVTAFMDGFWYGVQYYNQEFGADVTVLGWDPAIQEGLFTNNFESLDDGRAFAESLMDEGADVILPVAGPTGLGTAAAVQARGSGWIIGVDTDWTISSPEYADVVLTSILKRMDTAVYTLVQQLIDGRFPGGTNYVGTLENEGVGLAGEFPPMLVEHFEALIEGIINEEIQTNP